jgi:glycosyltransferase involved in cell wall biosynthesis
MRLRLNQPSATGQIVVSHPARQHSYETALAAQKGGLLYRYLTSFYRTGRPLLPHVWFAVPASYKARLETELRRRWHPELDAALVSTLPLPHLVSQLIRRGLRGLPEGALIEVDEAANHAFDKRVARWLHGASEPRLIHCFEGGGLQTFRAAHRRSCLTVLDVPSQHDEYVRLEAEEARRWGLRISHHPARRSRRVHDERREADILLVPSAETATSVRVSGIPSERIVTLPYGADPNMFTTATFSSNGSIRVLFAGHIGLRKGVGYLLEAWSRISLGTSELLLVGDEDANGRSLLARYNGLYRRRRWTAQGDLPKLFSASDVFVLPSLIEGSPLVVYEAMAAGLPVVTTENAQAVVRHGVDGIVVPIRDSNALAEAMLFLYRNPEARRRMGAAGRQRIQGSFSWKHYRARLAAIYGELLLRGHVASSRPSVEI